VSVTLAELNALPREGAAELLVACCGSARWVERVIARRPYATLGELIELSDDVWRGLDERDWLEAFAHHPRIGGRQSTVPQSDRAAGWSTAEQSAVATAPESTRSELSAVNEEYERRFGFIYIVCAAGRSAAELLALARARLGNAPEQELHVAANEQRLITNRRLRTLITESP
jgi:2-oxo-4-hydroxy-4-carboxy-5-ureidoimidazoline decarboxylase